MNELIEQYLSEANELMEGITNHLIQLDKQPEEARIMNELFRLVHTLKGNSGILGFDLIANVLHASEDLMDALRVGEISPSPEFVDRLLDAMDFAYRLHKEIEESGNYAAGHADRSEQLTRSLRELLDRSQKKVFNQIEGASSCAESSKGEMGARQSEKVATLPEDKRSEFLKRIEEGEVAFLLNYTPAADSLMDGVDPFALSRETPGFAWGEIKARGYWPALDVLDAYRCAVSFVVVAFAPRTILELHYGAVLNQVEISRLEDLVLSCVDDSAGKAALVSAPLGTTSLSLDARVAVRQILYAQKAALTGASDVLKREKLISSAAFILSNCCKAVGNFEESEAVQRICRQANNGGEFQAVLEWIERIDARLDAETPEKKLVAAAANSLVEEPAPSVVDAVNNPSLNGLVSSKSLKVDHLKIDRLMNLIGELVVSKNAMPYLAQKAEEQFGVRELSREIKAQYSEINRIAEEMQDAIMQIRMMPVSVIFQRFPRLVRDISRRLGKEVSLVLEGEDTEADKTIIESLADPLIHIVRNSLDHGLETPEARKLAGKSVVGTLTIRARQEADRVVIEIVDDGKGIDPAVIKRKALERRLITQEQFERMDSREAIHLIFAPGFSTAEAISDLSGRGVGMDVVRAAVEKVDGDLELHSEVGRGTRLTISLPLSMAVTQVIIIESDGQTFGIPMDHVVETVRVPRRNIRSIKEFSATMLRGRLVPLKSLNRMLEIPRNPLTNSNDEYAVLVVRFGNDVLGVIVDEFRKTVDIIQKPLTGVLSGLSVYSGSALMGDGSVLMILNLREVL